MSDPVAKAMGWHLGAKTDFNLYLQRSKLLEDPDAAAEDPSHWSSILPREYIIALIILINVYYLGIKKGGLVSSKNRRLSQRDRELGIEAIFVTWLVGGVIFSNGPI